MRNCCGNEEAANPKTRVGKRKVIIDSDMGWDDILATLYLVKDTDIEIIGVCVTGCGEMHLKNGTIIAQTLMELGFQTQATICVGTNVPLKDDHVFPNKFRTDMDYVMGLLEGFNSTGPLKDLKPTISIPTDQRDAWTYMADTLNSTPEPVTILCIGGFTNVAKMLIDFPKTNLKNIEQIVAMAGAVWVDGNVAALKDAMKKWDQGPIYSTNWVAEWNVFVDAVAAQLVFGSNIPLTLVPLDACNQVMLDTSYIDKITATDPLATFAKNILKQKTGSFSEGMPVPIFDPLAAMIMAGRLRSVHTQSEYLDVNTTDQTTENQCGKTSVVADGTRKITIVQGVSAREFSLEYLRMMNMPFVALPLLLLRQRPSNRNKQRNETKVLLVKCWNKPLFSVREKKAWLQ